MEGTQDEATSPSLPPGVAEQEEGADQDVNPEEPQEDEADPGELLAMEEPLAEQTPVQGNIPAEEVQAEVGETGRLTPRRARGISRPVESVSSEMEERKRRADPLKQPKEESPSEDNINQGKPPHRKEPRVEVKEREESTPVPPGVPTGEEQGRDVQGEPILLSGDTEPMERGPKVCIISREGIVMGVLEGGVAPEEGETPEGTTASRESGNPEKVDQGTSRQEEIVQEAEVAVPTSGEQVARADASVPGEEQMQEEEVTLEVVEGTDPREQGK